MKKYRKAYLANSNSKFEIASIEKIADDIVYVCAASMFDDMSGDQYMSHFEGSIVRNMKDFDPEQDLIVLFGDAMIYAMMIYYIAQDCEEINVARYSVKKNEYVTRTISFQNFVYFEEEQKEK